MIIYKKIAKLIPDLELTLRQAKIPDTPEEYIQKNFMMSLMLAFFICLTIFFFWQNILLVFIFPMAFIFSFFYFTRYASLKIEKIRKEINREIVYAGRFLIIEIESGVPLYEAFQNLRDNYDYVGKYFGEIVSDVNFGTTLEDALDNAIHSTPSPELRKILWQVLNSMRTGADVKTSLNAIIDQIVREQQIEVKEYGRKLNPIAMFYMMMAIIVPSLGTTMLVVLATFIGFELPLWAMLGIVGMVGFVQFMFYAFVKSSRPPMAL